MQLVGQHGARYRVYFSCLSSIIESAVVDFYLLQYFFHNYLKLSGRCIRHDVTLTFKMNQPTHLYIQDRSLGVTTIVAAAVARLYDRSCYHTTRRTIGRDVAWLVAHSVVWLESVPIIDDRARPPATASATVVGLCKTCVRPPSITRTGSWTWSNCDWCWSRDWPMITTTRCTILRSSAIWLLGLTKVAAWSQDLCDQAHWWIQGDNPSMAPIMDLGRGLPPTPSQSAEGIVKGRWIMEISRFFALFARDYINNII